MANSKFDTKHKHLLKSTLFWWALLTPLVLGGALASLIAWGTDLGSACVSSQCVQTFIGYFKYPITVAGLSLPLVAMSAAIHRSMEAAIQIDLANKQYGEAIANNRFGNYLKHREGFYKMADTFCSDKASSNYGILKIDSVRVYSSYFDEGSFLRFDYSSVSGGEAWDYTGKAFVDIAHMIKAGLRDEGVFNCEDFYAAARYVVLSLRLDYEPTRILYLSSRKDNGFLVRSLPDDSAAIYITLYEAYLFFCAMLAYAGRSFDYGDVSILDEHPGVDILKPHMDKFYITDWVSQ